MLTYVHTAMKPFVRQFFLYSYGMSCNLYLTAHPLRDSNQHCGKPNSLHSSSVPDDGKPLKFTTSNASTWKAKHTRFGGSDLDRPWYQGLVISLSLGIFLLYFCVIREESDIDEEFGRSLYSRIEGLEENQLKISLKYNQEHGLDTRAIEERLKEINEQ